MTRALAPTDREHTAARLLASSARHTLDPSLEVDWDAPLVPGGWGLPPERTCGCKDALATAIITRPEHVPEQTKKELAPIIGKYMGT